MLRHRSRPPRAAILVLALAGCSSRPSASPESAIRFRDVTAEAGITFTRTNGAFGQRWMPETMGGGGAFLDYDQDGNLDILFVNGDSWPGHPLPGKRPTLALYRGDGHGHFSDVTSETGLNVSIQGMGVAVADYDGDGFPDLYITGVGGNRLFHNEGSGFGVQGSANNPATQRPNDPTTRFFRDVTNRSGTADSGWSTSAAWLDYDRDGRLDLFVCHYVGWTPATDKYCGAEMKTYCRPQEYPGESCRLFHNDGNGKFSDATKEAGVYNPKGKSLGVAVCDVDRDGLPDIVVANDMTPNFYYHNEGSGRFREMAQEAGIAYGEDGRARAGMGIDAADYTNSDNLGLAVGNFGLEGMALWDCPKRDGRFEEVSKKAGIYAPTFPYITFGVLFADFDNDGWVDLFATNGHILDTVAQSNPGHSWEQPGVILRNNGRGGFEDVSRTAGPGITTPLVGRGACRGDYDNDGKIDLLLIPNVGPARLLHNESSGTGHWLSIKLVGKGSNRDSLGSRVQATVSHGSRTGYLAGASSYLSASSMDLHFGLGPDMDWRSKISWPDGKASETATQPADKKYVLKQP